MKFDTADLALIEIDPEATFRELALVVEVKQLRSKLKKAETAIQGASARYDDVWESEDPMDPDVLTCYIEETLSRLGQAIK